MARLRHPVSARRAGAATRVTRCVCARQLHVDPTLAPSTALASSALGSSDLGRKGLCLVEGQPQALINVIGDVAGLPAAQVNRTVTGAEALKTGKTKNPAALVFRYRGAVSSEKRYTPLAESR